MYESGLCRLAVKNHAGGIQLEKTPYPLVINLSINPLHSYNRLDFVMNPRGYSRREPVMWRKVAASRYVYICGSPG